MPDYFDAAISENSSAVPDPFAEPAPAPLATSPTRAHRAWDFAGLACLLLGAGLYLFATNGMSELAVSPRAGSAPAEPAMVHYNQLWQMSRIGLHLGIAGLGISVLSALRYLFGAKPGQATDSQQPL